MKDFSDYNSVLSQLGRESNLGRRFQSLGNRLSTFFNRTFGLGSSYANAYAKVRMTSYTDGVASDSTPASNASIANQVISEQVTLLDQDIQAIDDAINELPDIPVSIAQGRILPTCPIVTTDYIVSDDGAEVQVTLPNELRFSQLYSSLQQLRLIQDAYDDDAKRVWNGGMPYYSHNVYQSGCGVAAPYIIFKSYDSRDGRPTQGGLTQTTAYSITIVWPRSGVTSQEFNYSCYAGLLTGHDVIIKFNWSLEGGKAIPNPTLEVDGVIVSPRLTSWVEGGSVTVSGGRSTGVSMNETLSTYLLINDVITASGDVDVLGFLWDDEFVYAIETEVPSVSLRDTLRPYIHDNMGIDDVIEAVNQLDQQ